MTLVAQSDKNEVALVATSGGALHTAIIGSGSTNQLKINTTGSIDAALQDQTTPTFYMRAIIQNGTFTLASDINQGEYTFNAVPAHGILVGEYIELYNQVRWIQAEVLGVATNTITVDQPFDYDYESGTTICYRGDSNLNVNGSGTVKIARITNKNLLIDWDITRINVYIQDAAAMDHSMLGNIAGGVTRGVQWRYQSDNGDWPFFNGYNAKTNGELAKILNVHSYTDKAGGGEHTFEGHKFLGGQENLGVVIRLVVADQDTMQVLIQDDLTPLAVFSVDYEGSVVLD